MNSLSQKASHTHGDGGEHSHEGVAANTWLDPTLAIAQAEAIAAEIATRDLSPADDVYANFDDLRSDLEEVDSKATADFEGVRNVSIIATHPRYQYLARRYGLSITSLEWEAEAVPSDEDLREFQKLMIDTNAHVLMWEATPPKTAIQATNALGLQSMAFDPLASPVPSGSFTEAIGKAVSELANAMVQVLEN